MQQLRSASHSDIVSSSATSIVPLGARRTREQHEQHLQAKYPGCEVDAGAGIVLRMAAGILFHKNFRGVAKCSVGGKCEGNDARALTIQREIGEELMHTLFQDGGLLTNPSASHLMPALANIHRSSAPGQPHTYTKEDADGITRTYNVVLPAMVSEQRINQGDTYLNDKKSSDKNIVRSYLTALVDADGQMTPAMLRTLTDLATIMGQARLELLAVISDAKSKGVDVNWIKRYERILEQVEQFTEGSHFFVVPTDAVMNAIATALVDAGGDLSLIKKGSRNGGVDVMLPETFSPRNVFWGDVFALAEMASLKPDIQARVLAIREQRQVHHAAPAAVAKPAEMQSATASVEHATTALAAATPDATTSNPALSPAASFVATTSLLLHSASANAAKAAAVAAVGLAAKPAISEAVHPPSPAPAVTVTTCA